MERKQRRRGGEAEFELFLATIPSAFPDRSFKENET